ncbi:hypothetical protein GDO81_006099 [Engystomops pustulosus]|uniref:Aurora kinase A and ninein-interacting protein n=1 Tax=Engystomops pustulosus TaxID=76066 RepID=A0AAV7CVS4_ENGPU|nr:hypothetical protein GDO81_006099 [Engystomops pustulosus]
MKSRKRARPLPQPEECGVWLDASQLKKKSHQTIIPCISSRFNPLSRRQPTDSVLVEFTQTKSPQLCTKQTSMYSFFSLDGNRSKRSCIADNNILTEETSPDCEKRNALEAHDVMNHSPTRDSICPSETYKYCEPEIQENLYFSDIHRNAEELASSGQNENNDQSCQLEKLENPGRRLSSTSVCRSQDKSLTSPLTYRTTVFSTKYQDNIKDPSMYPQVCYKDDVLPSQSGSQLFTQDTQGNKVICHRHMNAPLKDRTNVTWDTRSQMKGTVLTSSDEDSLHKIFTQDSEGNLVIKH